MTQLIQGPLSPSKVGHSNYALLIVSLEDIPQHLAPFLDPSSTPETNHGYVRHN